MSEMEVYPAEVRRHVWESLVSMMQVYAHAASLNGKEYVVTSALGQGLGETSRQSIDRLF